MRKQFRKLGALIRRKTHFASLELRDRKAGRQLRPVLQRNSGLPSGAIFLFATLRNEQHRLEAFVRYYRKIGVDHFFFVNNGSTDGFEEWAAAQPDVSTWYTEASYRESAFGMLWLNDLLRRFGTGHWCVVVDPDEFLVYPYMETRSLKALTSFLVEERRQCMHTVTLDAYSRGPINEAVLADGDDPFVICPYFDRDGYIQQASWGGSSWIRGGVRLRTQFGDDPAIAPALNKIPLVRWQRHFHYRMSMHDMRPLHLNKAHQPGSVSTTGALFHFKLVASLAEKAAEEEKRGEHYAGGREYAIYRDRQERIFFRDGISVAYSESAQLVELGLISPGKWF